MSYPQLLPDSNPAKDYVSFSVPNKRVVRKIARDFDQEENLRVQVLSKALTNTIDELAFLFSKCELEVFPAESRNETRVILYVPYLRPKSTEKDYRRKAVHNSYNYMLRLHTIPEEVEEV